MRKIIQYFVKLVNILSKSLETILIKITSVKNIVILVNTYLFYHFVDKYFTIYLISIDKNAPEAKVMLYIFTVMGSILIVNLLSFHSTNYLQKVLNSKLLGGTGIEEDKKEEK